MTSDRLAPSVLASRVTSERPPTTLAPLLQARIGNQFHTPNPSIGRKEESVHPECACGGRTTALTNDGGSMLRCSECEKVFSNPIFCPQCKEMANEFRYDRGDVIACSRCKISWSSKKDN